MLTTKLRNRRLLYQFKKHDFKNNLIFHYPDYKSGILFSFLIRQGQVRQLVEKWVNTKTDEIVYPEIQCLVGSF